MKRNSLLLFLEGQTQIKSDGQNGNKILNLCMENRIVYRDFTINEEGEVELWCSPYMAYILERECLTKDIRIRRERRVGLPYLLKKYKHRTGIFLGIIFVVFMLAWSRNFIWDIRVTGNERVTYSEITSLMGEYGLMVGSKISELDVDRTESLITLNNKNISWITINIIGTHANVQIRESDSFEDKDEPLKPSNLVATRDGQIEYLELFGGNPMVRSGDVVRKGDILVSGIWDSNHYGMFVTRSNGKVYASTIREFEVKVCFDYEKKVATERKTREKYLIFFSKEIKVFENCGKKEGSCDTIEGVENLRFFNRDRLPIGIKTVSSIYYDTVEGRYTEDEAMNMAYYQLQRQIESEIPDGQILSKKIDCEITDEAYILRCTVNCIENIAEVREFDYVYPQGN